jgi:hypothetical protein
MFAPFFISFFVEQIYLITNGFGGRQAKAEAMLLEFGQPMKKSR